MTLSGSGVGAAGGGVRDGRWPPTGSRADRGVQRGLRRSRQQPAAGSGQHRPTPAGQPARFDAAPRDKSSFASPVTGGISAGSSQACASRSISSMKAATSSAVIQRRNFGRPSTPRSSPIGNGHTTSSTAGRSSQGSSNAADTPVATGDTSTFGSPTILSGRATSSNANSSWTATVLPVCPAVSRTRRGPTSRCGHRAHERPRACTAGRHACDLRVTSGATATFVRPKRVRSTPHCRFTRPLIHHKRTVPMPTAAGSALALPCSRSRWKGSVAATAGRRAIVRTHSPAGRG
jgi:hypothetical protein